MEKSWKQELSREIIFQKRCFHDYYSKNDVDPPFRFARREWGFFPFGGKMMFRHISFQRSEEMLRFFRDTVPMHSYYSVAYYEEPALKPMGDKFKTWMGSDLIFDLDADHLQDADTMTFEEQLAQVKREVRDLLFNFILGDLGLPPEHTYLHFSGGRGYHIHVRAPEVLQLNSRDRRAIVDYITGKGVKFEALFPEIVTQVNPYFGSAKTERDFRNRNWGGWVRKIYEGKDKMIDQLGERETKKDKIRYLLDISASKKLGIKDQKCKKIVEDLFFDGDGKTYQRMKEKDTFRSTASKRMDNDFIKLAATFSSIDLKGETDEPVTTDIKRLIRVPSSLHGKTGLKVCVLDPYKLEEFDPLRDAIALPSDEVEVNITEPFRIRMNEIEYDLKQGKTAVPRYLAYLLIGRKRATLF